MARALAVVGCGGGGGAVRAHERVHARRVVDAVSTVPLPVPAPAQQAD